ncbi:MAG TPA: adenylate/guanylate cyclase domain-containing protein [Solirubrobacterales bacterium]|nr:adenylate/guanylate cyclase domain-containing protein [Solirubrobacterales bacterium]
MRAGSLPGRKAIWLILVAALSSVIAMTLWGAGILREIELDSVDQRFEIRGSQGAPDDVVIVDIDDRTFNDLGAQWPFPRSFHGRVIDQLRKAGAAEVAYDVQFTEPTIPKEDNALIRAVGRMGGVVLSTTEVDENGNSNVFGGEDVLRRFDARAASTIVDTDQSGTIRKMPYETDGLVSFPVAVAEQLLGEPISRRAFTEDGSAWIDYRGPPGTIRTVPFSMTMRGELPPGVFRGKTVVVGSSAPSLQDRHPTSTSGHDLMSGPEIQANGIWTAEHGFPLSSSSGLVDLLLIILLSAAAPALMFRFGPVPSIGLAVAVAGLYLLIVQLAFGSGTILPVTGPLSGLAFGVLGSLAVSYMDSAFERQRVRDTFARFVPESVVSDVLERTDEDLRLGGLRRECSVLFCDLRDFTAFAESLDPDRVILVLNRYLTLMSDEIMDQGGTLVAFMGDGIMAVFGAPIGQEDHADRALRAARSMVGARLDEFNEWVRAEGLGAGFRIGIGLNSGPVMSGQVGSTRRIEYTAIGDTTNTASRLESLTSDSPHDLLLSEATRIALTSPPADLVDVGEQEIRGRSKPVRLWSIADQR